MLKAADKNIQVKQQNGYASRSIQGDSKVMVRNKTTVTPVSIDATMDGAC